MNEEQELLELYKNKDIDKLFDKVGEYYHKWLNNSKKLDFYKQERERLDNIINELEKDLIEYFKKEYPDRKLEDYNLENCTYDYALVILGRLQELKGSEK